MGQDVHTGAYRVGSTFFHQIGSPTAALRLSITQHIYKDLHANGLFRLETADQTYCEDDKLFLADRFVEGTCPSCGYEVSIPGYSVSLGNTGAHVAVVNPSRTHEATSAINAPSLTLPLHLSSNLDVSGIKSTPCPSGLPPTLVLDWTSFNRD